MDEVHGMGPHTEGYHAESSSNRHKRETGGCDEDPPFQPRPEWDVRRGNKGKISRERCAGKKALDERNRRLRERSSIDRLRELLPESYKNAKVKSKRFGPRKKCCVCLGYRECHLEGSTRSDFEAAVH